METQRQLEYIKNAIEKRQIDFVIRELKDKCLILLQGNSNTGINHKEIERKILHISSQHHNLKNEKYYTTSEKEVLDIKSNRITSALIDLVCEIEEEFSKINGSEIVEIPIEIKSKATIRIILDRDFNNFSKKDKQKFLSAIAELLSMEKSDIKIENIKEGSVEISISIPKEKAIQLMELLENHALSKEWNFVSSQWVHKVKTTKSNLGHEYFFSLRKAYAKGIALNNITLTGSNLKNAWLKHAKLKNSELTEVDLQGANLEGADISQSILFEANLFNANLLEANFSSSNLERAILIKADLRSANFSKCHLNHAKLCNARLQATDFSYAKLNFVDFENAALWYTNFENADLASAKFINVDLRHTTFENAELKKADFSKTSFEDVNFKNANLDYAIFHISSRKQLKKIGISTKFINFIDDKGKQEPAKIMC